MRRLVVATAMFLSAAVGAISCADDCPAGSEKCACTGGGACDPGLECRSELCVDAGNPGGGSGDFCADYVEGCPADSNLLADCQAQCAGGDLSRADMTLSACWFLACGAEVGMCDQEQLNDDLIMACAADHGWN